MSRKTLFNAYPQIAELDNYSKFVATKIYAAKPHWLAYAAAEEYNGKHYLAVKIPAPAAAKTPQLIIGTYSRRITVYYDHFHAHFGGWTGASDTKMCQDALAFVNDIMREQLVVGIKVMQGETRGARCFEASKLHQVTEGTVSYTRSWLGTFDREYDTGE